jgi:hypothetical protein
MFLGNGTTLTELLMPKPLSNAATALVEAMNLNSIKQSRRNGRAVVIKNRNIVGEKLAKLANAYFRKAGISIHFIADTEKWRQREIESYNLLNGDTYKARPFGDRGLIEDKLPGRSLWEHMKAGTLTARMIVAAATELRRAHRLKSREFPDGWSHGDATTTNAIYDPRTNRVRWIDFEILHNRSRSAKARHADDVLVFLLDMVGQLSLRQWLSFALCFITAYADPAITAELRKKTLLRGGLAWGWWEVRTNFTAPATIKDRLAKLRSALLKLEHYRGAVARTRHKRRPSMNCQRIKPGIPMPSSRILATNERAKAASPGIPRRLPTKT